MHAAVNCFVIEAMGRVVVGNIGALGKSERRPYPRFAICTP